MTGRRTSRIAAVTLILVLAASCGSDDETSSPSTDAPAATTAETAAPSTGDTTASSSASTDAPTEGTAGCPAVDTSLDETGGVGAGLFMSSVMCAGDKPLAAAGEPIVIGFQNPEGDPNGSFPEATLGAEAAVKYINEELGGWGSDIQNGVPGRPIQLEVCKTAISPDDSQRCANEIVSKEPELAVSTINFFGNHLATYQTAGVPVIITSPVTIADFTSPAAYAIAGGGGCLGQHTGLVEFATSDLEGKRIGVPWADTPPGVVCYYDLEAKPLDVLKGTVKGSSERAGTIPDLEHIGIPIKPATPDLTAQVTQLLDFKPDVIIFSAQGADCWNLVDALGRLGWDPTTTPLVLSGACIDFDAMKAAGDLAKGIYFVTTGGSITNDPATIEDPRLRFEAETFQSKPLQYGMPETDLYKGFGSNGFNSMINVWELSTRAKPGGIPTGQEFFAYVGSTERDHMFGTTPLACKSAPAPYIAVCNTISTVAQWDGESLVPVRSDFSGADLIAGTELKPGP